MSLVPFGKYKGQPVEVLQQDQEYCTWLAGQEWFRTKFVGIHTLIINHFGEPHDTPQHNALQARFLDPEWCQRVAISAGVDSDLRRALTGLTRRLDTHVAELHKKRDSYMKWCPTAVEDIDVQLTEAEDFLKRRLPMSTWDFYSQVVFESAGADIAMDTFFDTREPLNTPKFFDCHTTLAYHEFRIECKPSLGDDYPEVLRRMKSIKACTLVAGTVESRAVTVEQMREIFGLSGLRLLLVEKIESQELYWDCRV